MFQADDGDEVATERMLLKSTVMNSVWRVKMFQLKSGLFHVLDSILFCGMETLQQIKTDCFLSRQAYKMYNKSATVLKL